MVWHTKFITLVAVSQASLGSVLGRLISKDDSPAAEVPTAKSSMLYKTLQKIRVSYTHINATRTYKSILYIRKTQYCIRPTQTLSVNALPFTALSTRCASVSFAYSSTASAHSDTKLSMCLRSFALNPPST